MQPPSSDGAISIKHHEHFLYPRYKPNERYDTCRLCRLFLKGLFYACDFCKFYVHKSCSDFGYFPYKINHSFHPSHQLLLIYLPSTWCHSCHRYFKDEPGYECTRCDIFIDTQCAFMPENVGAEGQQSLDTKIEHVTHQHSLSIFDKDDTDRQCFACKSKISGKAYYGCAKCNFFLDKECAEFPQVLHHPLHRTRDLLSLNVKTYFFCHVCETKKEGPCNLNFKCQMCEFRICWTCNFRVKKSVKYEDHQHLLYFVEGSGKDIVCCDGYNSYCKQSLAAYLSKEFDLTKSSIFHCFDCDFKVHLLCGPLPSFIRHECHIHSLDLYDSIVEDDFGEYYCDVCETERDPRIRVYYCKVCKFFAHVHCMISKIVDVLMEVELKILGEDSWSNSKRVITEKENGESTVLTLSGLLDQLNDFDRNSLEYSFVWYNSSTKDDKIQVPEWSNINQLTIGDEEIEEILEICRLTKFKYEVFCYRNTLEKIVLKPSELASKLVEVKGYLIPYSLAGVLETLLDDYGNTMLGEWGWSYLSREIKSFTFYVLCRVVKRMRATMVKDITKNLLAEWRSGLNFVRGNSLEIGFTIEQLEMATLAFLGLQAERLEDEIPTILKAKMVQVQRRLDKCRAYRESDKKTELVKDCLKIASEFRWKNVF